MSPRNCHREPRNPNVFRGRCLPSLAAYRSVQCVIIGGKTLKLLLASFINEYRDSKEYLPVLEIRYHRKYVKRLEFTKKEKNFVLLYIFLHTLFY